MKHCVDCETEMEEGARHCSSCGKPVSKQQEPERDIWAERLQQARQQTPPSPEPEEPEPQPSVRRSPTLTERILLEEVLDEEANGTHRKLRKLQIAVGCLCAFVVVLVMVLVTVLGLSRKPVTRDVYQGISCRMDETWYSGEGDWAALQSDGGAELFLLGSGDTGTYELQEDQIQITCGGKIYQGTLKDGVLELKNGKVEYTLAREGMDLPEDRKLVPNGGLQTWAGDYYGFWRITQAWGAWEDAQGETWDVCGRIWMEDENLGKLELWDTQCRMGELFAAADLKITQGLTDLGCLENGLGRFCDFELQPGHWTVDPGREPYRSLPGVLLLQGSFQEQDSGFAYEIYLRPWGRDWEDVKDLPMGKELLPPHYKSWYLPLLGQNAQMPQSFYGLRQENE